MVAVRPRRRRQTVPIVVAKAAINRGQAMVQGGTRARVQALEKLSKRDQQALLRTIDAFLAKAV